MSLLRSFFVPKTRGVAADLGLLLVRLAVGAAFLVHGWGKMQNPFGWMGTDGFAPPLLQALAAISEFGGGAAFILGLLTPLAALGITATMVVAVTTHAVLRGDPFVGHGGPSYELATAYLSVALLLLTNGPGRFSLDRIVFGRVAPKG
jgi:putative oxidoreductase